MVSAELDLEDRIGARALGLRAAAMLMGATDDRLPVLLTGVGKVRAATSVARLLATTRPSVVVNIGTAGGLRHGLDGVHEIGTVIQHDFASEAIEKITGVGFGPPIVLGAGPIGLAVCAGAVALGARVAVTAGSAEKLERCRELGAEIELCPGLPQFFPALKEHVRELGRKHNIDFVFSKDGWRFTPEYLAQFDAFLFYTTGDLTMAKSDPRGDGLPPMTAEGKAALLAAVASTGRPVAARPPLHRGREDDGRAGSFGAAVSA